MKPLFVKKYHIIKILFSNFLAMLLPTLINFICCLLTLQHVSGGQCGSLFHFSMHVCHERDDHDHEMGRHEDYYQWNFFRGLELFVKPLTTFLFTLFCLYDLLALIFSYSELVQLDWFTQIIAWKRLSSNLQNASALIISFIYLSQR